jgi:hypothetical protein
MVNLHGHRWGGTPLQDAVNAGQVHVASLLRSKGGTMPESLGATQVCDAAAKGDVQTLRLLIECAGLRVRAIPSASVLFNLARTIHFGAKIICCTSSCCAYLD